MSIMRVCNELWRYAAKQHGYHPAASIAFRHFSSKSREKQVYVCSSCGAESPKWVGTCPMCSSWDTMKAFRPAVPVGTSRNVSPSAFGAAPAASSRGPSGDGQSKPSSSDYKTWLASAGPGRLTSLDQVSMPTTNRLPFHSRELDRLFGGGLVKGSVVLLAGTPGVGKSTLLLQIAALLSNARKGGAPYAQFFTNTLEGESHPAPSLEADKYVAYISGEESVEQIKSRAERLGIDGPRLMLMNETRMEDIISELERARGTVLAGDNAFGGIIVDSIQTIFTEAVPSAAGSVTQVRECATRLLQYAKATDTPIFLVGHVTKTGDIAGPRVLEHLVDTVIYIESEEGSAFSGSASGFTTAAVNPMTSSNLRLMRAVKHRFGPTSEVGIFEMTDEGFVESDASKAFLSNHQLAEEEIGLQDQSDGADGSGSTVAVTTEGTRSFCVELQALATASPFPYPRHRSTGIQMDRIHMLLAVLSRHARVRTHNYDLFVNVVGGLKLYDTSTDVPVALSIASSILGQRVRPRLVAVGEVGLGGEIRAIPRLQQRLQAAKQLGFRQAIVPSTMDTAGLKVENMQLLRAQNIAEALRYAFGKDYKKRTHESEKKIDGSVRGSGHAGVGALERVDLPN